MKIKQLKAHGFKSFADGIRLELHEGVTGIVGPNGCGKSNIVDAIRWTMGEISARHLRGKAMEDVIFGGSEYRKPLGRAEVSMVISDVANALPEPFNQFTEMEVTRRLYRATGDSEYFINQIPCRRRDIAELFLESGVGTRTISIIEQGHVGDVVKARPAERRFFIEQAAGILKYKSRRESAKRKLEQTKQNLMRVKDVLTELTRQRAMLERQAEKAQRYREIVETLRQADLAWAAAEFLLMDSRRGLASAELDRLRTDKEAQTSRLSALENQIAQSRLERTEREHLLTEAQEALMVISRRIGEIETAQQVAAEGVRHHGQSADLAEEEAARLEGRAAQMEEEERAARAERDEMEVRLGTLSERLSAARGEVEEENRRAEAAETAREEARARLQENLSRGEKLANRIEFGEESRQEIERRSGKLEAELGEVASHVAELSQTSFGFAEALKGSRESQESLASQARNADERLAEGKSRLETTRAELRAAKENLSEKATRLSSLREIERRYEGYGEGVQAIMLEAERRLKQEGRNGIYGMVADVVKTRPEYERAVESLLGDRLQYIVVKSKNEGIEAVEFLKRESKGRGSFVPLTLRAEPVQQIHASGEGVIGSLREVVDVKEGYETVADYLFSDALLVDRLDRAVGLWDGLDRGGTLVTLDGDVVDRSGVITGGALEGVERGILQKKREIDELAEAVEEAGEAVRELEAREAREVAGVAAIEGEVEGLRVRLHRVEIEITSQEKDVQRIDDERTKASRRREVIEGELRQERESLQKLEEEIVQLRNERASVESARSEAEAMLAAAAEGLARQEETLRGAVARLEEVKLEAASLRERAESVNANVTRLGQALEEVRAQVAAKKELAGRERDEVARLEAELESRRQALSGEIEGREAAEKRLAEVRELFETGEEQLSGLEGQLAQERAGIDELSETLGNQQFALREIELQVERVEQEIRERYEMELRGHVESLDPAERERLSSESLHEELREEAEKQRRRLKAVGAVNLDSIEEYDQVIEREKFLQTQHDDLVNSVNDLEKAIAKINKTTRERFKETFDAVDARFREVFPKLFRGGKARLELTDPANLLETGVDIIAQPPGKKLASMTMLSGGEQTLTAVALLLAIFLIRPSPFVILDEVDAALDDVNVDRFNDVVKELNQHSQVIMITHNKQSMEIANTLVGVTMEEPGVSKLVSVQMS